MNHLNHDIEVLQAMLHETRAQDNDYLHALKAWAMLLIVHIDDYLDQ